MEEPNIAQRLKECICCKKPVPSDDFDALFCSECGTSLYNKCSNYSCGEYLERDEKYCKYCGARSLFLNAGYFTPNSDEDLPF